MKSTSPPRTGGGGRSSNDSSSSLLLLIAVAMVSFFAGTVLTAHIHLGSCTSLSSNSSDGKSNNQHHSLDAKVEELAQKRLLGE